MSFSSFKRVAYFLSILLILLFVSEYVSKLILSNKAIKQFSDYRFIRLAEYNKNYNKTIQVPNGIMLPPFSNLNTTVTIETDSNAFIITDKNIKSPDLKLFFLGGSTTECLYVKDKLRFPELTARLLEKKSCLKINSYNCGYGGINSLQSLNIFLNKVIPCQPDFVFMMHNINDLVTLNYNASYWSNNNTRGNIYSTSYLMKDFISSDNSSQNWFQNTCLLINSFNPSEDEFSGMRKIQLDSLRKIKLFKQNLEAFVTLSKVYNIQPVLLTQANNFDILDDEWFDKNRAAQIDSLPDKYELIHEIRTMIKVFNLAVIEVAKKNNCLYIDIDAKVNDTKYFYDEVHLNNEGSTLVANIIADFMQKKINDSKEGL